MNPDILFTELRNAGADEARDWEAEALRLRTAVQESLAGSNVRYVLRRVQECAAGQDHVRILDFGSGSGKLVAYLRMLGYDRTQGVDVRDEVEAVNRTMAARLGFPPDTFATYDRKTLPYADASFDLLVSEEVLEHVHDLDGYYCEAARVLRPGGSALFFFPHRLTPFDSHSRTWFAHYLPRPLRSALYDRLTVQGGAYFAHLLNLRGLSTHRRLALRHFSSFSLHTARRLREAGYGEHYEGNRGLRAAAQRLIEAPLLGGAACWLFSRLAEAEVLLVK